HRSACARRESRPCRRRILLRFRFEHGHDRCDGLALEGAPRAPSQRRRRCSGFVDRDGRATRDSRRPGSMATLEALLPSLILAGLTAMAYAGLFTLRSVRET